MSIAMESAGQAVIAEAGQGGGDVRLEAGWRHRQAADLDRCAQHVEAVRLGDHRPLDSDPAAAVPVPGELGREAEAGDDQVVGAGLEAMLS